MAIKSLNKDFLFPRPCGFSLKKQVPILNGPKFVHHFNLNPLKLSTPDNDKSGEDFKKTFFLDVNPYAINLADNSCEDPDYPGYLTDLLHSLIQLESLYLSSSELNYSLQLIVEHIKQLLALLDREGVEYGEILSYILESSTVLNREVSVIDFHVDMLKSIRYLLTDHMLLDVEHVAVNSRVEANIAFLYARLHVVLGRKLILQEMLLSTELSLNAYSIEIRKQLVGIVEDDILCSYRNSKGLNRTRPTILPSIREKGSSEHCIAHLVTIETTSSAFSNIFDKSIAYRYSDEMFEQELNGRLEEAEQILCSENSTLRGTIRDKIGNWAEDAKTPGLSFSNRSVAWSVRTTLAEMYRIFENECRLDSLFFNDDHDHIYYRDRYRHHYDAIVDGNYNIDDDDSYDHYRNHNYVIVDDDDDDDDDSGSSGTGGGSCSVQKRYIDLES